jgi:diguanylate cyclase (GGDEF)-like protein
MRRTALRACGAILLWFASLGATQDARALAPADPVSAPVLALAGAEPVAALTSQSVFWFDRSGHSSIESVAAGGDSLPWRLRQRDRHERLQGGALWIRFDALAAPGERWFVEVGGAVYDEVQFFFRNHQGAWVRQDAGSTIAVSDWAIPGRLPTFALAPGDGQAVRYWVRVQDDRADFSSPISLFRSDTMQTSREREQFLFGGFFALTLLVTVAALGNGLLYRDRAFLTFGLYILLLGAGQLGRAGVGAQHLWPDWAVWNGTALGLWPGAATAAALWFVKVVTEPKRLSRALDLGVAALIATLLAAVALDIVLASTLSITLVLSLTGLSMVAVLSMVLWGWLDGHDPHLRLVALGFAPVLLMALFPLARGFGLVPSSVLTRAGLFYGAALELPILFYALHRRLMARRESELRASALSRTDALTGLPHRRGLVERLDSSLAHARGQKQQCALLGVRISNLEAIAEEFGKEAAEKALVVAASHLRRAIVDYDMAARVGDREFAVLLEAPVTQQTVSSRAQQVVASGLRQVEALPAALTLKFHVTAAMLPLPQLDGEASLQWVLDGLDGMTQGERKLIRPLNF